MTGVRSAYEEDGFCMVPEVVSQDLLPEACGVMDRVIGADYETGLPPLASNWHPGDDPMRLVKIDQPQVADHAITRFLEATRIGEIAADLVGADMVQCWAVQLLFKPGPGTSTGNVGWHQDDDYWHAWWEGEVFTCWLALSDVTAESGPMRFVSGSHDWGFLKSGNFFDPDMKNGQAAYPVPGDAGWDEVPAIMPPGGASFHHRRTIHGSGPNLSSSPRRSYAVHLRTERSVALAAPKEYLDQLDDQDMCPILFQR